MSHHHLAPTLLVAVVAGPILGCASSSAPVLQSAPPEPATYLAEDGGGGDAAGTSVLDAGSAGARQALASGASVVAAGVRATSGAVRDLVRALARLVGDDDATPSDVFLLRRGVDTLAIERVTRQSGGARRSLLVTEARSADVTTTSRADGAVESVQVSLTPADATEPVEHFRADIVDDSIVTRSRAADGERVGGARVPFGTLVFLDPSPSFYELLVQHGRASRQAISDVPVLVLGNPTRLVSATVAFYGDSALVMVGDAEARLAVDREGRVRGGTLADGSTIERARVAGVAAAPPPGR
jgi:hypothetical protein